MIMNRGWSTDQHSHLIQLRLQERVQIAIFFLTIYFMNFYVHVHEGCVILATYRSGHASPPASQSAECALPQVLIVISFLTISFMQLLCACHVHSWGCVRTLSPHSSPRPLTECKLSLPSWTIFRCNISALVTCEQIRGMLFAKLSKAFFLRDTILDLSRITFLWCFKTKICDFKNICSRDDSLRLTTDWI